MPRKTITSKNKKEAVNMEASRVRVYVDGRDMGAFPPETIPALKEYFRSLGMVRKVKTVLEVKEVAVAQDEDDGNADGEESWILCEDTITTPAEHAWNVLGPAEPDRTVLPLPWAARKRAELLEILSQPEVAKEDPLKRDIQAFMETGKLSSRLAKAASAFMERQQKEAKKKEEEGQ